VLSATRNAASARFAVSIGLYSSWSFVMQKSSKPQRGAVWIYMNAERYRIAYIILRTAANNDSYTTSIIAPPSMVLAAFANELYFKCLLHLQNGSTPQTHNLKALFRDLATQTRQRIEQLWNAYAPSQEEMWRHIEQETGKTIPRDLAGLLDISAKGFTELRYLHEDDSGAFFVGDLPPMLRQVILEKMPMWATFYHTPPTSQPRGTPALPAKPPESQQDGSQ